MKYRLEYLARCIGAVALGTVTLTLVCAASEGFALEGWIVSYLAALAVASVGIFAFTARSEEGFDD